MIQKLYNLPLAPYKFVDLIYKLIGRGKIYLLKHLEHNKINKILAPNIALAVMAGSLVPATNTLFSSPAYSSVIDNNKTTFTTTSGIENPVTPIKINQGFYIFHPGVDLGGYMLEPIHPIMSGTVSDIQHSSFGYGNAVIVDHGSGLTSLYAHMSKILVELGESVHTNSTIGLMGATGHATGTHLHLEIRQDGIPQNPFNYLRIPQ